MLTWPPPFVARRLHNKPLPSEQANCRPYFERELEILQPRAVLALGSIAMRAYLGLLKDRGMITRLRCVSVSAWRELRIARRLPRLFASYHPEPAEYFHG